MASTSQHPVPCGLRKYQELITYSVHDVHTVPVMSYEDEVSLVVEGDDSSSPELRVMREESGKHPSHGVTQTRGKVVQDYFWLV